MNTVKVKANIAADSSYIVVEHIVRADFFTSGVARNEARAMVYTPDGKSYRVEGKQALELEKRLAGAQLTPTP